MNNIIEMLNTIDENQQAIVKDLKHCNISIPELYKIYSGIDESLRSKQLKLILSNTLTCAHALYSDVFDEILSKRILYINTFSKEILVVKGKTLWSAAIIEDNSFTDKLYKLITHGLELDNTLDVITVKDPSSDTGISKNIVGIKTQSLRKYIESMK